MDATRREFLGKVTAGAAAYSALPLAIALSACDAEGSNQAAGEFDFSWPAKLTGKHKSVFDMAEVESGYGLWRGNAWAGQVQQYMGVPATDVSLAIILRHNAIVLAMDQAFWDKYGVGKMKSVTHPMTQQPTDKNPVLLGVAEGVPAPFDAAALPKQQARGVVFLACNLAFNLDVVPIVVAADKVSEADARKSALTHVLPGVLLQPSGVFAATRAQETGCTYVKAS
ncbi:MAG: hypothetical protein ACREUU_19490 [Gammaproteobacteria bacterium]